MEDDVKREPFFSFFLSPFSTPFSGRFSRPFFGA